MTGGTAPADVSVVIPAYNAAAFLGEAIVSVLSQRGPSCEVIVVNDGSTDDTAEVAAGYAQVRLVNRSNGGIGAARNSGLREAKAPLIAFLDADDVWPAGRLQHMFAALASGVDAVFGEAVEFGESREETPPQPALLAGTLLMRREAAARVGAFQEGLHFGEFIDWWARAEEAGLKVVQIPDVVLRRRIHTTNTGITQVKYRVDYTRVLRAALERRRGAS